MTAPDYVAQAATVIREFIVEAVGFDHGELMTAQAENLARTLAAAGLIPTSVEWGVSWRGVPQQSLGGPLTEDEARSRAIHDFALIARAVTDWKDASDD